MIDNDRRPSALGGFWTLIVGGASIVLLLLFLHPVTRPADCPNHGGNGNASAFGNTDWDLFLPLTLAGWLVLIAVEQTLPASYRGRGRLEVAARAAVALSLAAVGSCFLFLGVATICH